MMLPPRCDARAPKGGRTLAREDRGAHRYRRLAPPRPGGVRRPRLPDPRATTPPA